MCPCKMGTEINVCNQEGINVGMSHFCADSFLFRNFCFLSPASLPTEIGMCACIIIYICKLRMTLHAFDAVGLV